MNQIFILYNSIMRPHNLKNKQPVEKRHFFASKTLSVHNMIRKQLELLGARLLFIACNG